MRVGQEMYQAGASGSNTESSATSSSNKGVDENIVDGDVKECYKGRVYFLSITFPLFIIVLIAYLYQW